MRDALSEATDEETERLRAEERRSRWRGAWAALDAWQRRLSTRLKRAAALATAATALYTVMQRPVRWLAKLYHARDIGPAEYKANGVPSTALDFWSPGYKPPGSK